jgi:hypothetical protein
MANFRATFFPKNCAMGLIAGSLLVNVVVDARAGA